MVAEKPKQGIWLRQTSSCNFAYFSCDKNWWLHTPPLPSSIELTKIRKPPMNRMILKDRRPCSKRVNLKTWRDWKTLEEFNDSSHVRDGFQLVEGYLLAILSILSYICYIIIIPYSLGGMNLASHSKTPSAAAFKILMPALDPPLV